MYNVYVLQSRKDKIHYIGITSKDLKVRLREHNSNKSRFTRGHQPWDLVYSEQYIDQKKGLRREHFLKSGQGRKWLRSKIG
jgi:predicted GIY-YIG superfamily endonuclease